MNPPFPLLQNLNTVMWSVLCLLTRFLLLYWCAFAPPCRFASCASPA